MTTDRWPKASLCWNAASCRITGCGGWPRPLNRRSCIPTPVLSARNFSAAWFQIPHAFVTSCLARAVSHSSSNSVSASSVISSITESESFGARFSGCGRNPLWFLSDPISFLSKQRTRGFRPDRRNPLRYNAINARRPAASLGAPGVNWFVGLSSWKSKKLPERNPLRNLSQTAHPATRIDRDGQIGRIAAPALLGLRRWIEQRGRDPRGGKPCESKLSGENPPQRPPVITVAEHGRIVGSPANAPAEGVSGDPRPNGAEQLRPKP